MLCTSGISLLVEKPNASITLSKIGMFFTLLKIGAVILINQISLGISDIILSLIPMVNFL